MRVVAALLFGLLGTFASIATPVEAHESRPAHLEIRETSPGRYWVLWRTPVLSGAPLPVVLKLPDGVTTIGEPTTQRLRDSLLERRVVDAGEAELAGRRVEFVGLQATITDVLVRLKTLDGGQATVLVHPRQAWFEIPASQDWLSVMASYTRHGIDHILFGYDHLLFVLALILIVRSVRILLWTVTAFTIAHSITLALSTLGVVRVAGPPVEAAIALSILLMASEILRGRRGRPSATSRWPWIVAFGFGLLHGFGFAGALADLGLPHGEIPTALFGFNLGVEIGQLGFICTVWGVIALARRIPGVQKFDRYAVPVNAYGIGCLAAYWFLERAVQIL